MRNMGSILALIGGLLVLAAGLATMFLKDFKVIWNMEFSIVPGFVVVGIVLAGLIVLLGFLSFSAKPRLLGAFILAASFAGIVVGTTLIDLAMLFSVCGGMLLFTLPERKTPLPKPGTDEHPNPS